MRDRHLFKGTETSVIKYKENVGVEIKVRYTFVQ